MGTHIQIAIDGPAAAGKSTVAKITAGKLGYVYIDTGSMYRALTWKAIKQGLDPEDEQALIDMLKESEIRWETATAGQIVLLDGIDVTDEIRSFEVTNTVSIVAKHPLVRIEMVRRQQLLAQNGGVVMDGRDIGTHVLPAAELKIFLVASVEERAKRRYKENISKGIFADLEKLKEEIALRDQLDSEREASPLKQAEDAIALDSTSMSIDDVVNKIMELARERINKW